MKRVFICAIFLFLLGFGSAHAQEAVSLDNALKNSTTYFVERIPTGSKVVILNFQSEHTALTDYIIDELTMHLVDDGKLTVVDRQNLEILRQEMDFQLSGEVSDESAQAIGRKLGAQTIISGAIAPFGNMYRLRVRAIAVETAAIQGVQNINIIVDNTLAVLTKTTPPKTTQAKATPKKASKTASPEDIAEKFSLDGKRVFAISGTGMLGSITTIDSFTESFGFGVNATLYEKYFSNTSSSLSFFIATKIVFGGGKAEGNISGGGVLVKWRSANDRLLFNTGLSLEFFRGYVQYNDGADNYSGGFSSLGMGIQVGFSYRLTRNIALDLNAISKFSAFPTELEWSRSAGGKDGTEYISYNGYRPFVIGAELGITFMFPY